MFTLPDNVSANLTPLAASAEDAAPAIRVMSLAAIPAELQSSLVPVQH